MTQEITPEARDVFLDSADALIESDGAREALATALAALSGIKTCQRSLLTGAEKNTTVIVTSRSGFRTKGNLNESRLIPRPQDLCESCCDDILLLHSELMISPPFSGLIFYSKHSLLLNKKKAIILNIKG